MMKKSLLAVGVLSLSLFALNVAQADDHAPKHFKGVASDTYEQAVANLQEYNAKLAVLMQKEQLSPADMGEIHQLTYTLEKALERIKKHIEKTAEVLEDVHQATEKAQYDKALTQGRAYLKESDVLLK
jgi:uncharacterized protein YukE